MEQEIWKDIPGYEGLYQVSTRGRVRSIVQTMNRRKRVLSPGIHTDGYHIYHLTDSAGKTHSISAHRAVALTFIENPERKPCVEHIDANPANNCVWNLRWSTYTENNRNPITNKRQSAALKGRIVPKDVRNKLSDVLKGEYTGVKNWNSKKVVQFTKNGVFVKVWDSLSDVGRSGVTNIPNLCRCLKGRRKSAGGYRWEYADGTEFANKEEKQ